jgi:hypothetical protein
VTAWPLVRRRLLALVGALPSAAAFVVYDGPPVTGDAPTDYVTVGYRLGEDIAGGFERGVEDNCPTELGTVVSEVVCSTGNVDLLSVEARAFALVDDWQNAVDADQTLGVLPAPSTCSLTVDVQPAQNNAGSEQRLIVTLTYLSKGQLP